MSHKEANNLVELEDMRLRDSETARGTLSETIRRVFNKTHWVNAEAAEVVDCVDNCHGYNDKNDDGNWIVSGDCI